MTTVQSEITALEERLRLAELKKNDRWQIIAGSISN